MGSWVCGYAGMSSLRGGKQLFWYFVADVVFGLGSFDLNEIHQGRVLLVYCIKFKENESAHIHTQTRWCAVSSLVPLVTRALEEPSL